MFENRQIILARSGVIPRLYKLPQAIASLFGKKLYKDGRVENCEKASVTVLRKWYEQSRYCLPQGSIMLQSSSATCWPYPAYLYGKGTWAAVDILFFLPDVPITFMGELDGEIYRIKQSSVFQTEKYEVLQEKGVKRVNSRLLLTLAVPDSEEEK
jgi:starch synthase